MFALSAIVSQKGKKTNYIFLEPGICRIAYRHTEVWHTCLFIDVSSGQIYFVKRSRVGKINSGRKQFGKYSSRLLLHVLLRISKSIFSWLKFIEFFCKLNNSHRHLKYKVCHGFSRSRLIFPTATAWCLFFLLLGSAWRDISIKSLTTPGLEKKGYTSPLTFTIQYTIAEFEKTNKQTKSTFSQSPLEV